MIQVWVGPSHHETTPPLLFKISPSFPFLEEVLISVLLLLYHPHSKTSKVSVLVHTHKIHLSLTCVPLGASLQQQQPGGQQMGPAFMGTHFYGSMFYPTMYGPMPAFSQVSIGHTNMYY